MKALVQKLLSVLLAVAAAFAYYPAQDTDAAMTSDEAVTVQTVCNGVLFDGPGETQALIFYPGARVQETAYAPLLRTLAVRGVDCFAVKMPLGYAFLGMSRARPLMKRYDYAQWFLAGHSLGGAMASQYAAMHGSTLSGLILLGAYSAADLSKMTFPILYLYGSNDGILTREKLDKGLQMSASDTRVVEIAGGNHANFGSYGEQKNDGTATIPREEQIARTAEEILRMAADVSGKEEREAKS